MKCPLPESENREKSKENQIIYVEFLSGFVELLRSRWKKNPQTK
jgi:hypothetical protein